VVVAYFRAVPRLNEGLAALSLPRWQPKSAPVAKTYAIKESVMGGVERRSGARLLAHSAFAFPLGPTL
jgi:hypothetical protein